MENFIIRKFTHTDVDAFIRLAQSSFAEESIASGITLEDFESETRRIFRWKMIPYKLLMTLMGVKWEAFVAEKDGKVVGGGMYIGRSNHMTITNLMVDPEYRRQGIGQALLVKRLERLSVRGFPYVTAQVLETNKASLANLSKQDFEVFNRYSIYERNLPLPRSEGATTQTVAVREITGSDRSRFREIEQRIMPPPVLRINGSAESQYFQSTGQKMYARFTGYSGWMKASVVQGEPIGFFNISSHRQQRKGHAMPPVIADEQLKYLPAFIDHAGAWLVELGKESIIMEVPEGRTQIREYLVDAGWQKKYTWYELIRWLGESARDKIQDQ